MKYYFSPKDLNIITGGASGSKFLDIVKGKA